MLVSNSRHADLRQPGVVRGAGPRCGQDIVHLPVTDPTPVYPWSLLWHGLNRHPSLPPLIAHTQARYRPFDPRTQWLPAPDRPLFPPS